jgi:hypothetical protein
LTEQLLRLPLAAIEGVEPPAAKELAALTLIERRTMEPFAIRRTRARSASQPAARRGSA